MTDIICTETILYRQEATIFHSIPNKACKDANMILNDDVIDFKFWNKFYLMPINHNDQQITTQGVIVRLLMCHLPVFSRNFFFHFS